MTDLGEPTKIIGVEITQTDTSITISQKVYIESILKLQPNPDGNEGNRSNSFARLLGELQYLANCTRPDISFTVNRLAAYISGNQEPRHHLLQNLQ